MEQLINVINNPWFFGTLAGLLALYVVALSVVLSIWTARDIKQRTASPLARYVAPACVLVFGFAAFVPYLMLRPKMTFAERVEERRDVMLLAEAAKKFECPKCFTPVERDYSCCPKCQAEFKPVCGCGAPLDTTWKRCAYCGTAVSEMVRTRQYAEPITAVDLPPVVEEPKKLAKVKSKKNDKEKAKANLTVTMPASALKGSTVQKNTVQPAKKSGLTGRLRRALAIKR